MNMRGGWFAQVLGFVGVAGNIGGAVLLSISPEYRIAWIIWPFACGFMLWASVIQRNWWVLVLAACYMVINFNGIYNWYIK